MPSTSKQKTLAEIENAEYDRDGSWLCSELLKSQQSHFYGELTIKMENGLIVLVERTERLKPPHKSG